jgi:hypothetical protein
VRKVHGDSAGLGIGAVVGFCVSLAVLALLWSGVAGVLNVGRTDLMYMLWPSSLMVTVGWRNPAPGTAATVMSVAINCLLYMSVAYALYRIVRAVNKWVRS